MSTWILILSVMIALFGNTVSFITRKYFDLCFTSSFKVILKPRLSSHEVHDFCLLRNSLRKTFGSKLKKNAVDLNLAH